MKLDVDQKLIDAVVDLTRQAGDEIMRIYNSDDFDVQLKADNSPLTKADLASHNIIVKGLNRLTPNIPVVSEEDSQRAKITGDYFWLVDPIDGTKEFIKRNGEFTVNIGLIYKTTPVFGVVYVPAQDVMYYGAKHVGAFKTESRNTKQIHVSDQPHNPIVFAVSRSHLDEETIKYMESFGKYETIASGSSIKMCLVAEGKADIYPRFAPTMEWDIAAGHAVVEAAGGKVFEINNSLLDYNKVSLKNSGFIAHIKNLESKPI